MFKRSKGKLGKADLGEGSHSPDAAGDDRIGLTEAFASVSKGGVSDDAGLDGAEWGGARNEGVGNSVAPNAGEDDRARCASASSEPAASCGDPADARGSLEFEEPSELSDASEPLEFASSGELVDSVSPEAFDGEGAQAAMSAEEAVEEASDFAEFSESLEDVADAVAFADDGAEGLSRSASDQGEDGRRGKKKGKKDDIPPYLRKSRRMRRVLIVVIVLLLLLIAALGYFTFRLVQESQLLATQQAQEQQNAQEVDALQDGVTEDTQSQTEKLTEAPDLVALLGLTQDEALEMLEQHGATLLKSSEIADENPEEGDAADAETEASEGDAAGSEDVQETQEDPSAIVATATIVLTEEPGNAKTGTPTVYLGMNKSGAIIQAGYSASTTALGYGASSFSDAVKADHVVEKTLQEAGANVPEGSVQLPEEKSEYATYGSDGKTLVKERCAFSGAVDIDGASHEWSAVLLYDYSAANASGNLVDTVRIIYVYVNA